MSKRRTFNVEQYVEAHTEHLLRLAEERGVELEVIKKDFRRFIRNFIFKTLPLREEIEFPFGSGIFYKRFGINKFRIRVDRARLRQWQKSRDNF